MLLNEMGDAHELCTAQMCFKAYFSGTLTIEEAFVTLSSEVNRFLHLGDDPELEQELLICLYENIQKAMRLGINIKWVVAWLRIKLRNKVIQWGYTRDHLYLPHDLSGCDIKGLFYATHSRRKLEGVSFVSLRNKIVKLPQFVSNSSRLPQPYPRIIQMVLDAFLATGSIPKLPRVDKALQRGNPLGLSVRYIVDHAFIIARMKLHLFRTKELVKGAVTSDEWQQISEAFSHPYSDW